MTEKFELGIIDGSAAYTLYAPLASRWAVFDNSKPPHARLVATSEGDNLTITEPALWLKLQKTANRA